MARGSGVSDSFNGLVYRATAVTVSNTLQNDYDALYIGSGGNLEVLHAGQQTAVLYRNIGDGQFMPLKVKYIFSSSTTCSNILGLKTS